MCLVASALTVESFVAARVNVELNTDPEGAELGVLGGAVLAVVAAFLTWVQVDVGPAAAGSTGVEGLGLLTLLLAVGVGVLVVAVDVEWGGIALVAGGVAIALVALVEFVDLDGAAGPGIGLYLTILAGLVVAGSGWLARSADDGGL